MFISEMLAKPHRERHMLTYDLEALEDRAKCSNRHDTAKHVSEIVDPVTHHLGLTDSIRETETILDGHLQPNGMYFEDNAK